MEQILRDRISERLAALDMTPFEAAVKAGLNRVYLFDLLAGKKKSVRTSSLPAIAEVLQCDVDYLNGIQVTPRLLSAGKQTEIAGIAERNAWRPGARSSAGTVQIGLDPRYAPERQAVFRVRGDHADWVGLSDGDYLVTLLGQSVRDGDLIIFRRRREGREEEITVRKVENGRAKTRDDDHELLSVDVLGRVIFSVRYF